MTNRAQTGTTTMDNPVSAAIHIQGPTIRCAEVVRRESALDLQRYGHRTFDVDVSRLLWEGNGVRDTLTRVGTEAATIIDGTDASEVRVVSHPLDVYSFFTPVSAALDERDRMRDVIQQAALVTGARSADSLRITPRSIRTSDAAEGDAIEWIHVVAVPKEVTERLDAFVRPFPTDEYVHMVSTEAAGRLMGQTERQEASSMGSDLERPYSLAVGQYPDHTEYALTFQGRWHHAHVAEEARSPQNRAYYGLGFLNRLGVALQKIDRLFVYGAEVDTASEDAYESLFGRPVEPLDPFQILREFPDRPTEGPAEAYVPCIGGALQREE